MRRPTPPHSQPMKSLRAAVGIIQSLRTTVTRGNLQLTINWPTKQFLILSCILNPNLNGQAYPGPKIFLAGPRPAALIGKLRAKGWHMLWLPVRLHSRHQMCGFGRWTARPWRLTPGLFFQSKHMFFFVANTSFFFWGLGHDFC